MPVQIHITGDTAAEAIKEFAILSASFSGGIPAPAAAEVKTAPKSSATTKPVKQPEPTPEPEKKPEPVKQPEPEPQPDPADDASAEPPEPTLEELRAKASEVAKAKGAGAVKSLLEQFEPPNISSVPKEARGPFYVELEALLEA